MKHKDIVRLVKSMKVKPLTKDTFEDFVQNANELFVPKGARFQEYSSKGYNSLSKEGYDRSRGKPEYEQYRALAFDMIEQKEIQDENRKWINFHFHDETHNFNDTETWGFAPKKLPLKFGFDAGKALYIAEQSGNGTPKQPWETLYLKLE